MNPYCINEHYICVTLQKDENKRRGVNRKIRTKQQISCSKKQKAKEIMQRERYRFITNGIFTRLRKGAVKSKVQGTGVQFKTSGVGKSFI